jgi:hypothetical protein
VTLRRQILPPSSYTSKIKATRFSVNIQLPTRLPGVTTLNPTNHILTAVETSNIFQQYISPPDTCQTNLKFRTGIMLVILTYNKCSHTVYVVIFMIYLHIKFQTLSFRGSLFIGVKQPYSPVVFNLFCSRTPRYNFSSTLYPQSCWYIMQVIYILYNLHLK